MVCVRLHMGVPLSVGVTDMHKLSRLGWELK